MNTKITTGISIALTIVLVVVMYYQLTNSAEQTTSLSSLIEAGVSQKCDFADTEAGARGTVYIARGRVRGDISGTANGQAVKVHMIGDGTTMRTWIEGMSIGFTSVMGTSSTTGVRSQGFDTGKELYYECSSWSTDDALFAIPTDILFTTAVR